MLRAGTGAIPCSIESQFELCVPRGNRDTGVSLSVFGEVCLMILPQNGWQAIRSRSVNWTP